MDEDIARFLDAITESDETTTERLVGEAIRSPKGIERLLDELIPRALEIVGSRWEQNEWTFSQEHLATDVCRRVVESLGDTLNEPDRHAPSALVVCAEGEWHSLAATVLKVGLQLAGWQAKLLGPSVSSSQLAAAIFDEGPDLVAVTCSMVANLPGARRMIATAHETGTSVIVGGRAFGETPDRSIKLGADGWAAKASRVPTVAEPSRLPSTRLDQLQSPHAAELRVLDDSTHDIIMKLSRSFESVDVDEGTLAGGAVWILRTAHAALLCDDPRLLQDHVEWHDRRARLGAALPTRQVIEGVVEALPLEAETTALWLEDALRRAVDTA
ncbi:MAG: cobalamin B12-binding domain-containing protein [Acidimicrobiia bacterium]|nr:cobalamin B12-binding domain-containing protein [Acidimicrobiia bacterium]